MRARTAKAALTTLHLNVCVGLAWCDQRRSAKRPYEQAVDLIVKDAVKEIRRRVKNVDKRFTVETW